MKGDHTYAGVICTREVRQAENLNVEESVLELTEIIQIKRHLTRAYKTLENIRLTAFI